MVVKATAREAGERAKVAVASTKRDVDPIGACVGLRGTRIQVISRELRGEKIDIVSGRTDPATFVARALSPAKVSSVTIGEDRRGAAGAPLVIVPDNQLSLAIGKKGQNARLAAKLTGMRIDIKSESEVETARVDAEESRAALASLRRDARGRAGARGRGHGRRRGRSSRRVARPWRRCRRSATAPTRSTRRPRSGWPRMPSPRPPTRRRAEVVAGGGRAAAGGRVNHVPTRTCLGCRQRRRRARWFGWSGAPTASWLRPAAGGRAGAPTSALCRLRGACVEGRAARAGAGRRVPHWTTCWPRVLDGGAGVDSAHRR